jgi:transcription termination factor Rho
MYNISDLNAMGEQELKTIAESMGLKKIDPSKKDELIYRILDEQAIAMATTTVAEKKSRTTKEPKAKKEKKSTESKKEPKTKKKAVKATKK